MSNQPKDLNQFTAQLISEKGLTNLEPEVREQMQKDLVSRIEDRINVAILKAMPEEKRRGFESLLDTGTQEDIQAYCQKEIPNLSELVAAELLAFRRTWL
ncbi:hypothetical protein EXS54_01075 [Patescibacteria group bacterium]|nr:hypothetical protein [Patescibacteria group bacterium]